MASSASSQYMQSCPAYERISPIIADMGCPKKVITNKLCDKTDISDAVPIDNISTESAVINESEHTCDKVSASPSNLSTTVVSTNS